MVNKLREVIWDDYAKLAFKNAIAYIKADSPQSAEKVKSAILIAVRKVASIPEIHPPDKLKINNDDSYRAFELYKYRISYRIADDFILILSLRHIRQLPLEY